MTLVILTLNTKKNIVDIIKPIRKFLCGKEKKGVITFCYKDIKIGSLGEAALERGLATYDPKSQEWHFWKSKYKELEHVQKLKQKIHFEHKLHLQHGEVLRDMSGKVNSILWKRE